LAGYETVWYRERGSLDAAHLTTLLNYAIALLMPTPKLGAQVLHHLLQLEFAINEHTRAWHNRLARSDTKGVTLAARANADLASDYVSMNRDTFIKSPS
jgi:hypothetical protein